MPALVLAAVLALGGVLPTASARAEGLVADDDRNVVVGLTAEHMWSADDGASWTAGSPDQEFRGGRTVVVAPLDAEVVASTPWDPARLYAAAGTIVLHDGALWRNRWYADPGTEPGSSDVWQHLRDVAPEVLATLTFTPWTGEVAAQYQADSRRAEIEGTRVIGYLPEWGIYDAHDNYGVEHVPFEQITHLNYAFGLIEERTDGLWEVVVADPWAALEKDGGLYQQVAAATSEHGVENMLSVGGWTNNEHGEFASATATPEKTAHLAGSVVAFMTEHGFTGVDIDWEYPSDATEAQQFESFIRAIRTRLTDLGLTEDAYYPLHVAVSPNHARMPFVRPEVLVDLVDSVNVMTYDYHGAFDPVTGHNAPLTASSLDADPRLNLTASLRELHEVHGVPRNQLLAGIAFYGRAWGEVDPVELREGFPGLGAPGSATVHGAWDDAGQNTGTNPWYLLRQWEQDPAFTRYWDDEAQVPYLYNSTTREFFTYDDTRSVQAKVDAIRDGGYGGAIIWELSGDTRDHELGAVVAQLLAPEE